MEKKPVMILTGPTAVGKTDLSIRLAKALGGEIISADSMQIYRHMDIGSAKITESEKKNVPHYLIDQLEPSDPFHVVRFQELAKEAMEKIWEKGRIPIVTGGTGFYIQALLYDIDFEDTEEDSAYRQQLETLSDREGPGVLHDMLTACDPAAAAAIPVNNVKRTIRALEYYHLTGRPISEHNEEQRQKESPYLFGYFVLNRKREKLYERINLRVDRMAEAGLLQEVEALKRMGYDRSYVSMQGIGYKEVLAALEGECTFEEALEEIKKNTRHFAKRQVTWFKREREVIWVDLDTMTEEEALGFILEKWKEITAGTKASQEAL